MWIRAVCFLVAAIVAYDGRASATADAIRDLLESDAWPVLSIGGEHVHAAEELAAVYRDRDFAPLWTNGRSRLLLQMLAQAESHGLRRDDYHNRWLSMHADAGVQSPDDAAELDVIASDAFLVYAHHLGSGKVREETVAGWHIDRPDPDLRARLQQAAVEDPSVVVADLLPRHPAYDRLRAGLEEFRAIARQGGWARVPDGPSLRSGDRGPQVLAVRRRLAVTGAPDGEIFDEELAARVRGFQARHGLDPDGVVGKATRAELNVPVEARIDQIEINLERWRWLDADLGQRYVLVNIAGFRAGLYDGDRLTLGMRAIVGRTYHRTPIFSDEIRYLVFSPYWNIPSSIARNEIRPKGSTYMRRNGIEVLRGGRLRQKPGPANPLGRVKFMFPNRFSVYLHDTPARDLFDQTSRSFSHGCIRLEKPLELATLLLAEKGWSRDEVERAANAGMARTVSLDQRVPVHILYWTAWADETDALQFRPDLYGRDRAVLDALHGDPE